MAGKRLSAGPDNNEHQPSRGGRDLAFFLPQVPGCWVRIGNGLGDDGGCGLYNAGYDFNDPCLSTGATCRVKLAQASLGVGC